MINGLYHRLGADMCSVPVIGSVLTIAGNYVHVNEKDAYEISDDCDAGTVSVEIDGVDPPRSGWYLGPAEYIEEFEMSPHLDLDSDDMDDDDMDDDDIDDE